jgi:rhodanese-related sulfurtransferase
MTLPQSPAQVRLDLIARREIALLDLREEDAFARGHPLFAANMPLSRLELEALDRLPRKDARIVIYDDGEGLTPPAAARLRALGYTNLRELDGGLKGWRRAGLELFQDVNSASKAFGELVEARRHTPSLSAEEAKALIDAEPNLAVLDARRWDEYRTMSIPRGVSAPGAELVLRAAAAAPDPAATIIVNCAGRTRSIIGAQSLINAGLPNPVFALRNGAIGWTLAGLQLDQGQDRRAPDPSADDEAQARGRARAVADRAGVRRILVDELAELSQDRTRTLYRFDVRTPEEFAAGHIPGFRSAPGGQLVQETDAFAPVRGARIVLADDRGVRADMTASWLAQMNWEVLVLDGGFDHPLARGPWTPSLPPLPPVQTIDVQGLAARVAADDVVVVDLGPSPAHRRAHIPGAWFAIRAQLAEALERVPEDREVVLVSPDGTLASLAAREFDVIADRAPLVLEGGMTAWLAAGLAVETGLPRPGNAPTDVYRRPYEGADHAPEAKQAYLDWEFGLVDQLRRDATHGFFVI